VASAVAAVVGLTVGSAAIANAVSAPSAPVGHHDPGSHGMSPFGSTPPAAFGKVATVGTNTFTLTTKDGTTVTVNVDASTTYLDHDVATPSFSDVVVGALVAVFGNDTSNTVAATKVIVLPTHPGGDGPPTTGAGGSTTTDPAPNGTSDRPQGVNGMPATMGTVVTVGTDAFTVTSFHGTTVNVTVDSSTTYVGHEGASTSFSSIVVGAHVAVFGTNSANTVAATKVFVEAPEAPETSEAPESPSSDAPGTSDGSHGHGGMWGPPPASTPSTTEQPASSVPNQQGDNATGQPWTWGPGHGGSQGGSSTSTGSSSQTNGPGWRGPSGGGSSNGFH